METTNIEQKPAGFRIRVVAFIIDMCGVGLPCITFVLTFSLSKNNSSPTDTEMKCLGLLIIFIGLIYHTYFVGKFGNTPGKFASGLAIISKDGRQPGYIRAFVRALARYISTATAFIGYLIIPFSANKMALHDYIAGTRVVYEKKQRTWNKNSVIPFIIAVTIAEFLLVIFVSLPIQKNFPVDMDIDIRTIDNELFFVLEKKYKVDDIRIFERGTPGKPMWFIDNIANGEETVKQIKYGWKPKTYTWVKGPIKLQKNVPYWVIVGAGRYSSGVEDFIITDDCKVIMPIPKLSIWNRRIRAIIPGKTYGTRSIPNKDMIKILRHLNKDENKTISYLIETLRDPDNYVRWRASEALKKIGTPASAALIKALRIPDKHVREAAARILGEVGLASNKVVSALIRALNDPDKYVRQSAAKTLGKIGRSAKKAIPSLIENIEDHERNVRRAAIEALGKMGIEAKEAIPALIAALDDSDWNIRLYAIEALGEMGIKAKEAVPALAKALSDSENDIRQSAAYTLGKIGPKSRAAVPALIGLLKDPERYIRSAAAFALGEIGPAAKEAIPALTETLKDSRMRFVTPEALKKIKPQKQ